MPKNLPACEEALGDITRGGGSGVHDLDDDELIAAVASCPVPVLAAQGHASDDLVVGRVADVCLPTPPGGGNSCRVGSRRAFRGRPVSSPCR